jgi:presenilin-like A22 family membrane protease
LKEQLDKGEERDAFFMGVGDVVIPGVLVVSSYINLHDGLYIASGVIIGVIIGFLLLMMYVTRGKPQAGLPYLCGGGIAGYIVSNILLYGTINGLTWLL